MMAWLRILDGNLNKQMMDQCRNMPWKSVWGGGGGGGHSHFPTRDHQNIFLNIWGEDGTRPPTHPAAMATTAMWI